MAKEKVIIKKGKAFLSKAGLVVDGMMILESAFPNGKIDEYINKNVEVRGIVEESPFPIKNEAGLPQQGFEGECITKIKFIRILKE